MQMINWKIVAKDITHRLIKSSFLSTERATDAKCAVFTLAMIKCRAPDTWLNPCLICLSRLEQMRIEPTDEHAEANGGASKSCKLFTKSRMVLRCSTQKKIYFRAKWSKHEKTKSSMQNHNFSCRIGHCHTRACKVLGFPSQNVLCAHVLPEDF